MFSEFERYINHIDNRKASNTVATRKRELKQFSEWIETQSIEDIEKVSQYDIENYITWCVSEDYARSTIERAKWASISAAYNYLFKDRTIDENPVDRLDRGEVTKIINNNMTTTELRDESLDSNNKDYLTKETVYELAESHAPEPTDRNELLIKLMFWTGIRVSELVLIEIGDDGRIDGQGTHINTERPLIEIYGKKSNGGRVVSYPRSEINPLLRDWVNHGRLRYKYAGDSNRLFLGHKKPLTKSGVGRVINEAAENMGIQEVKNVSKDGREYKRVTPHLLRHSHAMHYHNEMGVSLDRLKDHLGHSSVDITESFYAEGTEDAMVNTFGE